MILCFLQGIQPGSIIQVACPVAFPESLQLTPPVYRVDEVNEVKRINFCSVIKQHGHMNAAGPSGTSQDTETVRVCCVLVQEFIVVSISQGRGFRGSHADKTIIISDRQQEFRNVGMIIKPEVFSLDPDQLPVGSLDRVFRDKEFSGYEQQHQGEENKFAVFTQGAGLVYVPDRSQNIMLVMMYDNSFPE